MIAKVIPIIRLPRGLNVFDYKIPSDLTDSIKIGQLVKVGFRNKDIVGVIYKIQKTSKYKKIRPIKKIITPQLYLNSKQLNLIALIAKTLYISWSNVLMTFLPPLATKNVKVSNILYKSKKIKIKKFKLPKLENNNFINYSTYNDKLSFYLQLAEKNKKQMLIVCPDKKSALDIHQCLLAKYDKDKIAYLTSDLNKGQFTKYWQLIYKNKIKIVVGTKKCLFFPFKELDYVVIDQEGDFNHRQWEQSPRYQTVDIAKLIVDQYKSKLILMGCLPSINSYYHIKAKHYKYYRLKTDERKFATEFYKNEEGGWSSDFIINKMIDSPSKGKQILILTNRLNYSSLIQCHDCNYVYTCPECNLPLHFSKITNQIFCYHCNYSSNNPLLCHHCNGSNLKYIGLGQEKMLEQLIQLKPNLIFAKFNASEKEINRGANVVVSSTAILPYINEFKFTAVLIPILEQFITPVDLYTQWRMIYLLKYLQSFNLDIFVQSFSDNNILTHFTKPIRFLSQELNNLKLFNYPPYSNLVKFIIKANSKKQVIQNSTNLYNELSKKFTKNSIIKPRPAIPFVKDKKYRYNIILRNLQSKDLDLLTKINYPNVVYDINPPQLMSS